MVNPCEGSLASEHPTLIYGVCKGSVDIVSKMVDLGHTICKSADAVQDATAYVEDRGISNGTIAYVTHDGDEEAVLSVLCTHGWILRECTADFASGEATADTNDSTNEKQVE